MDSDVGIHTTTTSSPHLDSGFTSEAIGGLFLAVWVLASNITLILAILTNERRRRVSFYLHVCNLCTVGLLLGSFVLPLYVDYCLQGHWSHSDNLCRVWLIVDMVVCTVSVLAVLMMIFDRFVLFSCPDSAEGGCKFVLSATLIILPWLVGTCVVLPVYLLGETGRGVRADLGYCYLDMEAPYAVASELAGYAVPALAAFGLLVATSLTWCIKKDELRDMDWSEEREHKGWQVMTSWVICVAVIGMWFPFSALHVFTYLLDRSWPRDWMTFAVWLAYSNSAINPILWMIMPKLRQSVASLCCCFCCCKKRRYNRDDSMDDETSAAMMEFYEK